MTKAWRPPTPAKRTEWAARAAKKKAIVPENWVVYPDKVVLVCGNCRHQFVRPLVLGRNEPVFVCPKTDCRARNWVPVSFDLSRNPRG